MPELPDLDELRNLLIKRRRHLAALSDTTRDAAGTVELDQTRTGRLSRMDALQGQAMARATEGRRQAELRRIDAALERLNRGEFGRCAECGGPIPPGRLRLDPTVTRCLACAEQAEEGAVRRP